MENSVIDAANVSILREVVVSYRPSETLRKRVTGPESIAEAFRGLQVGNTREQLMSFYLDGSNCLIAYALTSIGTANMSVGHPREIYQPAVMLGAVSVILAHNHPSGQLTPSSEDLRLTERISEAGALLGIQLLDHVIVSDWEHLSLKETERQLFLSKTKS